MGNALLPLHKGRGHFIWEDTEVNVADISHITCSREQEPEQVEATQDEDTLVAKLEKAEQQMESEALQEWGGLTDKQTELVRNALARAEKWEAERQAKYAAKKAEDLNGQHVGAVGQRYEFDLVVERVHSYDTDYGATYINICRDASNNVIVYKGSNEWGKGEKIVCKATVKDHSEYEGVKQTMIQRPKVLSRE